MVNIKEIPDNVLVVLAIAAVISSVTGIWASLDVISFSNLITGAEIGSANVTIQEVASITMITSTINFSGSTPGQNRVTYTSGDLDPTTQSTINITNAGSVFVNISIYESTALFTSASYISGRAPYFTYNVTHEYPGYGNVAAPYGNCSVGSDHGLPGQGSVLGTWRTMPTSEEIGVICGLNFTDGSDAVKVELNITVPNDEISGVKGGILTFTATKGE